MFNQEGSNNTIKNKCKCCEKNHPCSNRCYSAGRYDLKTGCTAEEIAPGVYRCDFCKLIVFRSDKALKNYIAEISDWVKMFREKQRNQLSALMQKKLSITSLDEHEAAIYEAMDTLNRTLIDYKPLSCESTQMRKDIYTLSCAYQKLKSLHI